MPRPRSTKLRKQFGLRLDIHLMRDLEHLTVDERRFLNEMVEEAIRDLLKKYRDKPKGK